jgi:hypothetical protein
LTFFILGLHESVKSRSIQGIIEVDPSILDKGFLSNKDSSQFAQLDIIMEIFQVLEIYNILERIMLLEQEVIIRFRLKIDKTPAQKSTKILKLKPFIDVQIKIVFFLYLEVLPLGNLRG